jgi:hypothetical protein
VLGISSDQTIIAALYYVSWMVITYGMLCSRGWYWLVSYIKGAFRHLVELNTKNKRNVPVAVFIV